MQSIKLRWFTKVIITFIILIPLSIHSQKNNDNEAYYNWFDTNIGVKNLAIYNGVPNITKYRLQNNKHRFFNSSMFLPGDIHYQGLPYYNLELKYDLYEDDLLLKSKNGRGTLLTIDKNKIDSFTIDSHKFVHIHKRSEAPIEVSGFYEVILKTHFITLLKKNKKNILKKVQGELIYYEFKSDSRTLVFYKNTYHTLNKKKDLIRLFPEFKKKINSYYKTSRFNTDFDIFITPLLRNITQELLNQQNQTK